MHTVRLRGGELMRVAVATASCMTLGQSTRIFIFATAHDRYRLVLDALTLPDSFRVSEDGSAVLPTHESMETIFESAYVWNGSSYLFSPARSRIYDVPLRERRPYQISVRVGREEPQRTLEGTVALNFGQEYAFEARAGERVTVERDQSDAPPPSISLWYAGAQEPIANRIGTRWSAELRKSGIYHLLVWRTGDGDPTRRARYRVVLRIDSGLRNVR